MIKEGMASAATAPRGPWLGPEPPDLACPAGMQRVRFGAMGATLSVLLPVRQAEAGSAAVRDLFGRWEGALSRFLPESELACLNRHAGEPVAVSALRLAAGTAGAPSPPRPTDRAARAERPVGGHGRGRALRPGGGRGHGGVRAGTGGGRLLPPGAWPGRLAGAPGRAGAGGRCVADARGGRMS